MDAYPVFGLPLIAAAHAGTTCALVVRVALETTAGIALDRLVIGAPTLAAVVAVDLLVLVGTLGVAPVPFTGSAAGVLGAVLFLSVTVLAALAIDRCPQYRPLARIDADAADDCRVGESSASRDRLILTANFCRRLSPRLRP